MTSGRAWGRREAGGAAREPERRDRPERARTLSLVVIPRKPTAKRRAFSDLRYPHQKPSAPSGFSTLPHIVGAAAGPRTTKAPSQGRGCNRTALHNVYPDKRLQLSISSRRSSRRFTNPARPALVPASIAGREPASAPRVCSEARGMSGASSCRARRMTRSAFARRPSPASAPIRPPRAAERDAGRYGAARSCASRRRRAAGAAGAAGLSLGVGLVGAGAGTHDEGGHDETDGADQTVIGIGRAGRSRDEPGRTRGERLCISNIAAPAP